jgi:hypothetical protein
MKQKGSPKTGGRQKGTPNKTTGVAREAIALAADKLGGVDRLVAWAKEAPENERAFWATIYPKLIPVQLTGEGDGPLVVQIIKFNADDTATS